MRIGIDARLWNETGVGRYIRNLVKELYTIDTKNEYVLFVTKPHVGTHFDYLKTNPRWKLVVTDIHWHSLSEQLKFPHVLEQEQLDLMHFTYFSLPILYKKPFVVTIHDLIITHFPTGKASTLPYPLYQAKRLGYQSVLRHAVTNSKKIIVPLISVKEDVQKTLHVSPSKIIVTKEGVTLDVLQKHQSKAIQGDYFLYVGNAYPHKNVEFLLSAFRAFRQDHSEITLVLVGKNDYFYKQIEERARIEKAFGIRFMHNVDDSALHTLYRNAKAFISPSLMEGFGLPPLEAMSASCPVLLSDIPSFREVCGDAAFYFDPHNTTDLKEKMSFMYNLTEQEKAKQNKKGILCLKEFSWAKMARQTKAVYESSISLR